MRNFCILALMGLTFSTTSMNTANAAKPDLSGYAGVGDGDGDGYPVFRGTATAASIGYDGPIDCDDAHANINPGMPEVFFDGIDNDCSAGTADAPVSKTVYDRIIAGEYKGHAPSSRVFLYEYDECVPSDFCTLDTVDGVYVPSEGFSMVDGMVDGTMVFRNHGQKAGGRELLSDRELSHYKPTSADSGSFEGYSKKEIVEFADEAAAAAAEKLKKELEAGEVLQDAAIGANSTDIEKLQKTQIAIADGNKARDGIISGILDADVLRDTAIGENTAGVEENGSAIKELSSNGFAMNVGGFGGWSGARERTVYNQTIRGQNTGIFGVDFVLAADLDNVFAGPFASLAWGTDGEGSGIDSVQLVGFEVLTDVSGSGNHIGGFGAYRHSSHMSNIMDTAVTANGGCGGVAYFFAKDDAGKATLAPWARAGICGESYGSKRASLQNEDVIKVDGGRGAGAMAQLGISLNMTTVRDRNSATDYATR